MVWNLYCAQGTPARCPEVLKHRVNGFAIDAEISQAKQTRLFSNPQWSKVAMDRWTLPEDRAALMRRVMRPNHEAQ
jgi:hypothetical protein